MSDASDLGGGGAADGELAPASEPATASDTATPNETSPNPEGDRLQKVMAAAGVASRRVSEDLIAQGRVTVNGEIVREPGRRVLSTDHITVDDVAIQLDITKRYID